LLSPKEAQNIAGVDLQCASSPATTKP
jgi:hypothetical protein